jgi:phage gp36-like protein
MAYITQTDLESALSPATVIALFNDQDQGVVYVTALEGVLERASAEVDAYLARVYRGPFPIAQTPVPAVVKNCTLEFAIAFSFERHPEYVHTFGEQYRGTTRYKRACEMAERLATGLQEIPDWTLSPRGGNVGGIVYTQGPRTIIDNPDGTTNNGDF